MKRSTFCEDAREQKRAVSVGLVGNCAEVLPEIVRRGIKVDAVTDQTSAHDPLNGYVPAGLTLEEAAELRRTDPRTLRQAIDAVDGPARRSDAGAETRGRSGLRLRQQHSQDGLRRRLQRCV